MKTGIKPKSGVEKHTLIFTYNANTAFDESPDFKEGIVLIQEPGWDEVAEAYKWITNENGKLDLVTPGKFILDSCAIEIDDDLKANNRAMISVCSQLAIRYVMPITAEVKKK